jgi:hypothetical protein
MLLNLLTLSLNLQTFVVFNHSFDLFDFCTKLFLAAKPVHGLYCHIVLLHFLLFFIMFVFSNYRKIRSNVRGIQLVII